MKKHTKSIIGFTRKCPYCGANVILKDSKYIYHNNKDYSKMWVCSRYPKCDSYVGCHKGTTIPLGRLADANLRKSKSEAHTYFDPIWKYGFLSRKEAYEWLSVMLDIPLDSCHIGMFDVNICNEVVELCKKQNNPFLYKHSKHTHHKKKDWRRKNEATYF